MKKLQIFILIIFLLFSCSDKLYKEKNITEQIINHIMPKVIPTIHLIYSDTSYTVNFTFACDCNDKEKTDYLNSIEKLEIDFINSDDKIIKTFEITNPKISGIPNDFSNAKYILFFKKYFSVSHNEFEKFVKLKYTISIAKSKYSIYESIKQLLVNAEDYVLDLYPIIKNRKKTSVEFGIFAVRNKIVEEYIPNSETLRIEVLNNRQKTVWNSGYGGNFMQVINPVYPEKPGDSYTYSSEWLLNKNNGNKVIPGKYKVNLIIPSIPKPYFTSIDFHLEEDKNDK